MTAKIRSPTAPSLFNGRFRGFVPPADDPGVRQTAVIFLLYHSRFACQDDAGGLAQSGREDNDRLQLFRITASFERKLIILLELTGKLDPKH